MTNCRPDVAILLDHFGSGGVERVACHVANGLHRRGFAVEMVVLDDSGPIRPLLDESIAVHALGTPMFARRGRRMIAAVPQIARYLRTRSPRLFHSPGNHANIPAALATKVAAYAGALVLKVTNPLLDERMRPQRRWIRWHAYRWAIERAARVLVLTPTSAKRMERAFPALGSRVQFVHNPYVSDRMIERADDRAPADPPVILSMGRLSRQKNQEMLLRAAARLQDIEWRVRLCGTGPDEAALLELATELRIADRVEMPGFVADPVPEYLGATVTALSSRWEGLPAAALEAIACGCPVVSTASSPGLVDLLSDIGARQPIAVGDVEGFAQALREGLELRLPAVPPEAAAPYTIDAACDEHAQVFSSLLERQTDAL